MESDRERDVSLPSPASNPSHHQPLLRAAKSTAFKREERRKRKERKRQDHLALELARWEPLGGAPPRPAATSPSRVPPVDTPWPCDPPPYTDPAPSAAWSWGPPAEPPLEPPQAPAAATCPQAAAVRACRAFFGEHDDEEEEEEEEEQGNVARFFEELLEKDAGLRGLYEAERERGRFLCLVCEGIGARAGKRFAGCAALVQHAGSVARTKGRLAHRAFADAVGRLLGWGTGRTASMPADSDNDGACDQVDHLDDTQSAQMEMF